MEKGLKVLKKSPKWRKIAASGHTAAGLAIGAIYCIFTAKLQVNSCIQYYKNELALFLIFIGHFYFLQLLRE